VVPGCGRRLVRQRRSLPRRARTLERVAFTATVFPSFLPQKQTVVQGCVYGTRPSATTALLWAIQARFASHGALCPSCTWIPADAQQSGRVPLRTRERLLGGVFFLAQAPCGSSDRIAPRSFVALPARPGQRGQPPRIAATPPVQLAWTAVAPTVGAWRYPVANSKYL
jgi:hypothetical protein